MRVKLCILNVYNRSQDSECSKSVNFAIHYLKDIDDPLIKLLNIQVTKDLRRKLFVYFEKNNNNNKEIGDENIQTYEEYKTKIFVLNNLIKTPSSNNE